MSDIKIMAPNGFMGASSMDSPIESLLRMIAVKHGDERDWPEKYGAEFENEYFKMHPFCWCEKEDCIYCGEAYEPNFIHKPSGLKIWWYKYIGRSMEANMEITIDFLKSIEEDAKKCQN